MNFVDEWNQNNTDGRHNVIPCPHLALPDSWIGMDTRLILLIDNAVDGATTLALCGVCANTVVGVMAAEIFKQVIYTANPTPVAIAGKMYVNSDNSITVEGGVPRGIAKPAPDDSNSEAGQIKASGGYSQYPLDDNARRQD